MAGALSLRAEAISRGARMLRTALGPAIATWLEDPAVVEVMLNPDGHLWVDRLTEGLANTGERLSAADGERIVRLVAHHVGAEVHPASPRVSAELPETGERFEGLIPPVVAAPAFAIRKPAVAVFTLDDYVATAIMTRRSDRPARGRRRHRSWRLRPRPCRRRRRAAHVFLRKDRDLCRNPAQIMCVVITRKCRAAVAGAAPIPARLLQYAMAERGGLSR